MLNQIRALVSAGVAPECLDITVTYYRAGTTGKLHLSDDCVRTELTEFPASVLDVRTSQLCFRCGDGYYAPLRDLLTWAGHVKDARILLTQARDGLGAAADLQRALQGMRKAQNDHATGLSQPMPEPLSAETHRLVPLLEQRIHDIRTASQDYDHWAQAAALTCVDLDVWPLGATRGELASLALPNTGGFRSDGAWACLNIVTTLKQEYTRGSTWDEAADAAFLTVTSAAAENLRRANDAELTDTGFAILRRTVDSITEQLRNKAQRFAADNAGADQTLVLTARGREVIASFASPLISLLAPAHQASTDTGDVIVAVVPHPVASAILNATVVNPYPGVDVKPNGEPADPGDAHALATVVRLIAEENLGPRDAIAVARDIHHVYA